jgi:hypothetical protein
MKQVKPSVPENMENLPRGKEICRKTGLVSDTFLSILAIILVIYKKESATEFCKKFPHLLTK